MSLQWFVFSFCIIRYHSFIRWQCVAIACWYYGSVCCLDAVLVVSMCFFSPSGWRLCSVWNLHHPAVHSSQLVRDLLQVRLVYSAGGHWSLISDENRKLWSVGVCLSVCHNIWWNMILLLKLILAILYFFCASASTCLQQYYTLPTYQHSKKDLRTVCLWIDVTVTMLLLLLHLLILTV